MQHFYLLILSIVSFEILRFFKIIKLFDENFTKNVVYVVYVGIDWFSKKCTDAKYGLKIDNFSKSNFKSGQFKDCGIVRFNDEKHIKLDLFKKWKCAFLRENISIFKTKKSYKVCTYDFVMKK